MPDDSVINPIVTAIQSGDLANAERCCRLALRDDADEPDLLLLLGMVLQQQGRAQDALGVFKRLTELHPEDSLHWGNYATALNLVGDLAGAERAAETAVRNAPEDPVRLEQLGLLRLELGNAVEARTALMHAYDLAPASASIRIHAARACVACHDHQAETLLKPWREWLPLEDELTAELTDLLVRISEPWDSMELLEDLVRRVPTDWSSQLLLAKVYERVNQVGPAQAKLREILAAGAADRNPEVRREVMAQQAQLATRQREFEEARTLLEAAGTDHATDDGYYFALAKACDGLGDATAAMRALETAHALQIDDLRRSNPDLLEPDAPLLPHASDRVDKGDYRSWPSLKAPDVSQSPVFVIGFPRSGTTLLEQMLDAHPGLQSMDERPFFNVLERQLSDIGVSVPSGLSQLSQRDCDELRKGYVIMASGKVSRRWDIRLVDKNPLNMLWLPMIWRLFPRAQIILAVRHPCDVVWSCYLQNFRATPLIAACRSLEHLARAYVAVMENWVYHARLFEPDVLVSRHEDLVADTTAQVHKIATFLGIGSEELMLRFDMRAREKGFIRTPSYTQVIEPIHARGVGHWRQYREYFEPILPILQPWLQHWRYDADAPARAPMG